LTCDDGTVRERTHRAPIPTTKLNALPEDQVIRVSGDVCRELVADHARVFERV
jgi:hypothetical protein